MLHDFKKNFYQTQNIINNERKIQRPNKGRIPEKL